MTLKYTYIYIHVQDLDEAVLRRFSKRIYVRMPSRADRASLLHQLMDKQYNELSDHEISQVNKNILFNIFSD